MDKDRFGPKARYFDRWAARYDSVLTGWAYWWLHRRLLAWVPPMPEATVLDLGCGTGRLLERLAARETALRGIGVDLSEAMIQQAQQRNPCPERLQFVQGKAERLIFADATFDVVFCTFSFQHYPYPEAVLQQIRRVLRPGGHFYWLDLSVGNRTGELLVPVTPGGLRLYSPALRQQLAGEAELFCTAHRTLFPALLSVFVS
ncbi:class I SAM-dependent methyltransferase [Gloeobacter kilaueensis]|uniref:class I SAM-dependent methyltransferase n=1 Tax=Gloeobacter kilaueensis TaxID=1416614 RepID=UPI0004150474|nr:class I SAM-dependent methyltransferase [Gloeobacter kilaueensis]